MRARKRIFIRHRGRRLVRRLIVLAAVFAGLAACAPAKEAWTPAEAPKRNHVDWVAFHHRVVFAPGEAQLSDAEAARLARFVRRLAGDSVPASTRVVVRAALNGDARLEIRRESAVLTRLRNVGLNATLAPADGTAETEGNAVLVTLSRYVVTPPRCPDWSKPAAGDPANEVASNFGCATAVNLGLMVADPGTLLRGRAPGPADGEALANGIAAYRTSDTQQSRSAMPPPPPSSGTTDSGQ